MAESKISILSTSTLDEQVISLASAKDVTLDIACFIEKVPVQEDLLSTRLRHLTLQRLTAVFTSRSAVRSVAACLGGTIPDWKIFCTRPATESLVCEYFGKEAVVGSAESAGMLAELIIASHHHPAVIFFCGDRRRPELPDKLSQAAINVNEIEVYRTIETPRPITKPYGAILFYSPSGVHSFFQVNSIAGATVLFAVGKSTAQEIKKYSSNPIILASQPFRKSLLEEAIDYLQKNHPH